MQPTSDEAHNVTLELPQVQSLLPEFPEQSNSQTHAHDDSKPSINLQDTNVPE